MKKNMLYVLGANFTSLIINVVSNIILPKYLSIETYAYIKTYVLYISFAGIFAFGYNDGMYLKYGGMDLKKIPKKDLGDNFINYMIMELMAFIVLLTVGIFSDNMILVAFAFGMIASNMIGYLKSLYQGTGEFKDYGKTLNIEKIALFLGNIILLFVMKSDNYMYYIWIQVVVNIAIMIYLCLRLQKRLSFIQKGRIQLMEFQNNIRSGYILMLGNFSNIFFTGINRWFAKLFMGTTPFAMLSFAVSMENVLNVFTTPITISLYNYLCKGYTKEWLLKIKRLILVWGFFVIAAAFPAKFILENYLVKYTDASEIIFFLFATQVFYIIIKGIYINIYKANQNQQKYLKQMITMIIVAIILNAVLYWLFHTIVAIAVATLVTAIIWFAICEYEDKEMRFNVKEIMAMIVLISIYLWCGVKLSAILGLSVYLISASIIIGVLMTDSMRYIIDNIIIGAIKNVFCADKEKTE